MVKNSNSHEVEFFSCLEKWIHSWSEVLQKISVTS